VLRFIYQDVANKVLTPHRTLKYQKWIEEAEKARKTDSLDAKKNQYDKTEELITFYTFAPLELVPSEVKVRIIREILGFININESIKSMELHFEKDLPPPNKYMRWLSEEAKKHPIRYIRKQAETRRIFEGFTQIDAMIKTDNLLVLFETKFTSDISAYTKFGIVRNQIARIIDVGIDEARRLNKKLVVLLCTPSKLYEVQGRLYCYKMQEYSKISNIQKDIPWRTSDEISKNMLKATWISLEKIIEIIYRSAKSYVDYRDLKDVETFFNERIVLDIM